VPPSMTKPTEQERNEFAFFQFPNDGGSRELDFHKYLKRTVYDSEQQR